MNSHAIATAIDLGPWQLAIAAALVLLNAGASVALKLGLERRLLFAATRSVVQLLLLGFVLQWVFRQEGWWAVLLLMLGMGLLAGLPTISSSSSIKIVLFSRLLARAFALLRIWGSPSVCLKDSVISLTFSIHNGYLSTLRRSLSLFTLGFIYNLLFP